MKVYDFSPSSSLKCSVLVQTTQQLRSDSEVVVPVDSDILPHANWLPRAFAALADNKIGAVTGSQWHSPAEPNPRSILRNLWNCGVVVSSVINACRAKATQWREITNRLRSNQLVQMVAYHPYLPSEAQS